MPPVVDDVVAVAVAVALLLLLPLPVGRARLAMLLAALFLLNGWMDMCVCFGEQRKRSWMARRYGGGF
ncbi:hypothetical protein IWZ01DRAFT_487469 [Phyllosticta capitalensis]